MERKEGSERRIEGGRGRIKKRREGKGMEGFEVGVRKVEEKRRKRRMGTKERKEKRERNIEKEEGWKAVERCESKKKKRIETVGKVAD